MSLLLRDDIRVLLAPERVTLLRLRRGLRTRLAAKQVYPCRPAEADEPAWLPACEALTGAWREKQWQGGNLTAILSNHFVRYRLLPGADQLGSEEDRINLARFAFEKVHGADARDWEVRVSRDAVAVTTAVDRQLIERLDQGLATARVHLRSVQPLLMFAFNAYKRDIQRSASAFYALVEPGRILVALIRDGRWDRIVSRRCQDPASQLGQMLERERSLAGVETDSAFDLVVHAPDYPSLMPPRTSGWRSRLLPPPAVNGFSPLADGAYALALGS